MQKPREKRLPWHDTFMLQALLASYRSPDPNTQVGAALVDPVLNTVLSTGYNAFPRGIPQHALPWDKSNENPLENKYAYVVHAEKNAIANANGPVAGCTAYVTMHPCNTCAMDLIQAGIAEVVYLTNPYKDRWFTQAAQRMFEQLDIPCKQFQWQQTSTVQHYLKSLLTSITSSQ